jgi:DNA-binding CsgD family transcriptional regulator
MVENAPSSYRHRMQRLDLERRAQTLVHAGLELEELCLGFDGLARAVVPYVVGAWSTLDPASGLNTSCTISGLPKDPAREAELYRHEFLDGEPSSYLSLIAERRTTAVLSEVTGGDLDRASRYRHLLAGFGVTDELRTICWAGEVAWASATIYRMDGRFTAAEADRLAALAPHFATGVRFTLLRAAASRPEAVHEPPGILEAHFDGRIMAMTEAAMSWLELGGQAIVTAANVVAAAVRERPDWRGASSRLRLPDGRVLSLNASSISTGDGTVAVIIDRARPAQLSAMLIDAYGLTPRQRDVLGLLLLGRSMGQIASHLRISEHTANDHRKAIYTALGVRSRTELATRLHAEHYEPHTRQGTPPSPYGGFLRTPQPG